MDTTKIYNEEEYLMISGIQHYIFCRRQWALIYVEYQWKENVLTMEGNIIHERCHDEGFTEKRKGLLITRNMRVYSPTLGVTGQCDVVEFHRGRDGAVLNGHDGYWNAVPIEYKHGKKKTDFSDIAQLCAQAMCLEEMLCCDIPIGYIYYATTHSREEVKIDKTIREYVKDTFNEMHGFLHRGTCIKEKYSKKCNNCSLKDLCLPNILRGNSVKDYYKCLLGD